MPTNPYYQFTSGQPVALSRASSSAIRTEFGTIQAGFDAVNTAVTGKGAIAGQTWTGTHNFPATTYGVTAAFGSSGNAYATLDFVNAVATNAALPGQTGKTDYLLTTNGTTASFGNTINVSVNKLVDGTDKTKQIQFDASGITTGTTRKVYAPDRDVTLGGFTNLLVIRTTQTWTPPAGVTKAKITVVDGGQGSGVSASVNWSFAGAGGNASVSIRTISPAVTYTATVGSGGVGSSVASPGGIGGASSFSGTGLTTLTSANGDIVVPGAPAISVGTGGSYAGGSLWSTGLTTNASSATGIGQGAPGVGAGSAMGNPGAAGAIIIEY